MEPNSSKKCLVPSPITQEKNSWTRVAESLMQLDSVAKVWPGQAPWSPAVGTNCPDFCNSSPCCCLSERSFVAQEVTWVSPKTLETLRLPPFTSFKKEVGAQGPFISRSARSPVWREVQMLT